MRREAWRTTTSRLSTGSEDGDRKSLNLHLLPPNSSQPVRAHDHGAGDVSGRDLRCDGIDQLLALAEPLLVE